MCFAHHLMKVFLSTVCVALVVSSSGSVVLAHEADVPFENVGEKIVTGHGEEGGGFHPHYVFQKRLNDSGIWPNGVEMCFNSEDSYWSSGQSIGLTIRDALRKWDGGDFDDIATEQLAISYSQGGTVYSLTTPTTPSLVSGLERFPDGSGNWHKHFDFELLSPLSDGIYLLQMDMYCTDSSITESDPFYIVLRQDETAGGSGSLAEWDAAAAYVEAHLVPEPGTLALLASGMGAALFSLWRCRRGGIGR